MSGCLLFQYSFAVFLILQGAVDCDIPCAARKFDQDSVVCVCNATYCDTFENTVPTPGPANPYAYWYATVTTRDGLRLSRQSGSFGDHPTHDKYVFTIGNTTAQSILGFGGAFTDAATMNMNKLSAKARDKLIEAYFAETGIEYNLGRIPMASCDFSERLYSYDDSVGDLKLEKFNLTEEDLIYKIPAIKDAMRVSRRKLSLFGSPWSSPFWMKTNNNMTGKGKIKGAPGGVYHKTWANYFVKFLQSYKDHGIDIWGLTAQNEPTDGNFKDFPFQCLGWTPELQRDFIAKDLGPALEASGFGHVKLMILDDQRASLPYWAEIVLNDTKAAKYVSGIAVHWFEDLFVPPTALDLTYEQFGEKFFILNTEADEKDWLNKNKTVLLGNWHRGEHYFTDIIQDLKHGVSGWVDWNMALDMQGGPNLVENWADSAIIVNAEKDEFYKQPMFYAMAHFSKFVPAGSKVISHENNTSEESGVDGVFFLQGETSMIANFVNTNEKGRDITIIDPTMVGNIDFHIPAKSFVTFNWFRE
ncbi:lysosomal acid glucosylceramidase-like [Mercenaria mercenaria]|uniref:lysosomal acid glucosylceramidase-like n=1 Tax=Mercenaria mercenaria TaxID=6596 RepID=UPI001E1DFE8D|nr:lysosomal acid glucosylceramidase-like [Mercenaria mercenaria]